MTVAEKFKAVVEGAFYAVVMLLVVSTPGVFVERGFWRGYVDTVDTVCVVLVVAWCWRRAWERRLKPDPDIYAEHIRRRVGWQVYLDSWEDQKP